jgi:catechol 2,3-dioxygenase-like lactoylglutathione lyase family enzyme
MSRLFCTSLLLLALCWPASLPAETAAEVTDLVEPRGEPGLVQRLELITLATLSLAETERFYRQGYGLELEGPIELAPAAMAEQRRLWGVAEDFGWVEYRLSRPATWGMPRVRVLGLTAPAEPARRDWSAAAPGAQGIGFAAQDAAVLAERVQALGFGGVPLRETFSRRSDDSAVAEREAVHHGPDFVRAVLRERIGAPPYAPLDEDSGIGGPAWLSISTADVKASLAFWTEALDLEVRSDRTSPDEGRQVWLYARGARTGAVELRVVPEIDADAAAASEGGLARGIVGAGFVIHDLPAVLERLERAGLKPSADAVVPLPMLATRRVLSLHSPEGLIVELIEGG